MSQTVTVAYMPALHQGYIKFLQEHPYPLYLLDVGYVRDFAPRLDRDIRAVDTALMSEAVAALRLVPSVQVLTNDSLTQLPADGLSIIMPDEDVSHLFAEQHKLTDRTTFVPAFLRWERQISTTELEVAADRSISTDAEDLRWLRLADQEASKSQDWWRQVGAVAVTPEGVMYKSHNTHMPAEHYTVNTFGDPRSNFDAGEHIDLSKAIHAEAKLIAEAARNGTPLKDAKLYVTTFPCPNCAKLIAEAGVHEVYYEKGYSLLDAEDILKAHDIKLVLVKAD